MAAPRPSSVRAIAGTSLVAAIPQRFNARVHGSLDAVVVTGVSLNSKEALPGDLYAALPGENTHGARFAPDLPEVAAILTDAAGWELLQSAGWSLADSTSLPERPPVIEVTDPRAALGDVARQVYGTGPDDPGSSVNLVGITGTNGKTTIAYLITSALNALGRATGLIGTVETRIGPDRIDSVRTTPEAPTLHALLAVMAERELDTAVMEVSSHALALHRVDGVVFDVVLFTNLTRDHLEFHGTMESYFAAKATLFTPARARRAVVCVDDEWGARLAEQASIPVLTLSATGRPADIRVSRRDHERFDVTWADRTWSLRSQLPGSFNVVNTALAAVTLKLLGVPEADLIEAMNAPPEVPGRMEVVAGPSGGPRVVVDYAHTPAAVGEALMALRPTTPGRLIVVLGAGGDRDRGKRQAMGAAAATHADLVIITDDNPRSEDPATIRAEVLAGASQARPDAQILQLPDRGDAIDAAIADAASHDTVAVLGKGHEVGQEVAGTIHPFDDRSRAHDALTNRQSESGSDAGESA